MAESAITALRLLMEQLAPECPHEYAAALASCHNGRTEAALAHLSHVASAHPGKAAAPLIHAVIESADPALALEGLARLADAIMAERRDSPDKLAGRTCWPVDADGARALIALLAGSPFLTELVAKHPEWLPWLMEHGRVSWSRAALRAEVDAELADSFAETGLPDWGTLRRWHDRHLVRIGWADLARWLDIAEVAADLAALADVTIDTIASAHASSLTLRYGAPLQDDGAPARWCVFGLGKLGGNELNFRSDIDLMFLYSAEGQSEGDRSPGVTLHEWFSRWAEHTLDTLSEVSPDGMLYRVDTRLRPDGRSGPLVRSLASYEHYYETRGEVWERQMLIKARPVAGTLSLGETLLKSLESFVFPRSMSQSPREEIRRIKSRILSHLAAQDASSGSTRSENDLKLRRGGLRDIEFIIQCLQLVVGGADRTIRSGTSLVALEQMRKSRVLTEAEVNALAHAYRLYRRIEHRLQMASGQRTFELPGDPHAQHVLARRLGYEKAGPFLNDLEKARADVIRIYDDVLGPPESPDDVTLLLELPPGAEQVEALLAPYGFREPGSAHRNLRHLAYGHEEAIAPAGPRQAVVRLVPKLLDRLRECPDPDRGLRNLERMLTALGAVESFSDLLASHPGFLELLVTLCSGSQSLTDTVLRDPALVDWMLYSGVLLSERSAIEVDLVLRASVAGLADAEAVFRALHSFRKQEVLRVGLRYLLKLADDDQTCEQLTAIADATVRQVYRSAVAAGYEHWGAPPGDTASGEAGLVVIALGKLGSSEMNFGSDLDLVFFHKGEENTTKGAPAIELFTSVAQAIVRDLSESSPFGTLYDVDTRLRPEGRNGPITLSLEGYRSYLRNRASVWERQALTRTRLVAGPSAFGREVMEAIHEFVYAACDGAALLDEVVRMRERMEDESRKRYPDRVNIKTGRGGLVDAEFVAQLGQLFYGARDAELRGRNTLASLRHLETSGRLPGEVVRPLAEGYRELRSLQMALRINDEHAHNVLPSEPGACETLAHSRGLESASRLRERVDEVMGRTRNAYAAALEVYRRNVGSARRGETDHPTAP